MMKIKASQEFLEDCCGTTCEKRGLYNRIKEQEDNSHGNDSTGECTSNMPSYGLIYSFVASHTK